MSSAGLERAWGVMARHVEQGAAPGMVAAVVHGGEMQVETVGAMSVGGTPVGRDSIFRIASMTKPIVAAATMILIEDGVLRLDDAVDDLLPELAARRVLRSLDSPLDRTVAARRSITVRDLLTFRMGFGLILTAPDTCPVQQAVTALGLGNNAPGLGPPPPEPDEYLRRLGTLPLLHQPGEKWMYNTGSDVLGVLITRACGQPLGDVLRERIFDPLGMPDTGFFVPPDRIHRLVDSYLPDPDGGPLRRTDPAVGGACSRPPAFPSGSGGLVSTVDDYLAFAAMLRAGGGPLLSTRAVEQLTTDQLTAPQRDGAAPLLNGRGWGFGVAVDISTGTYGWDGGLGTFWTNDPDADLTVVLLTQRGWSASGPPAVGAEFRAAVRTAIDG